MTQRPQPLPDRRLERTGLRPESRELDVAREVAEACLTASSALEVYRVALARVVPLVSADFGSVFELAEEDGDLLRLVCAHNWPQASARFLGDVRIRSGRGPTGRAVAEGRRVEAEDVFADRSLEDWWEPARELGVASIVSLPLTVDGRLRGAVSFYFRERQRFDDDDRHLLGVVADQLAATADRAARVGVGEDPEREGAGDATVRG